MAAVFLINLVRHWPTLCDEYSRPWQSAASCCTVCATAAFCVCCFSCVASCTALPCIFVSLYRTVLAYSSHVLPACLPVCLSVCLHCASCLPVLHRRPALSCPSPRLALRLANRTSSLGITPAITRCCAHLYVIATGIHSAPSAQPSIPVIGQATLRGTLSGGHRLSTARPDCPDYCMIPRLLA